MKRVEKCEVCQKYLTSRKQTRFCSRQCSAKVICKCPIRNKKLSEAKLAEKNPMWAGDKVKYAGLHDWVRSRLPKTNLCQICNLVPPVDLSNKGVYTRELENWWWLCRKCHTYFDGRDITGAKQLAVFKANKKFKINCLICGAEKHSHRSDTRFCSKKCLSTNWNNKKLGKPYFKSGSTVKGDDYEQGD